MKKLFLSFLTVLLPMMAFADAVEMLWRLMASTTI